MEVALAPPYAFSSEIRYDVAGKSNWGDKLVIATAGEVVVEVSEVVGVWMAPGVWFRLAGCFQSQRTSASSRCARSGTWPTFESH